MKTYAQLAAKLDITMAHPWAKLYKATLLQADPELFEDLEDDVDGYCIVQVNGAIEHFNKLRADGVPESQAQEIALANALPKADEEIAEDWEIDGAAEDEAAEFGDWLG